MVFCFIRRALTVLIATRVFLEAAAPIGVFVLTTDSPSEEIRIEGSNVANLVEATVERKGELIQFAGRPVRAAMDYLGFADAIVLEFNGQGTTAELTIPSTGYSQTFTASNEVELNEEVQRFLRSGGSAQIARMRKEANRVSPVGITDGNPRATTALLAGEFFDTLHMDFAVNERAGPSPRTRISIMGGGGSFEAGGFDGRGQAGRVSLRHRFSDKVEIVGIVPFSHYQIGEASIHGIGAGLGLPVAVLGRFDTRSPRLTLTPLFGSMIRWSEDLAGGGGILSGGLHTAAFFPVNASFSITGLAQINVFRSIPLNVDGYEFDGDVEQQLVKIGGQAVYSFSRNFHSNVYLAGNRFLQDTAVQDWVSGGLGGSWAISENWSLQGQIELQESSVFSGRSASGSLKFSF